ncbi:MAG TPA: hypothetical protein VK524_19070 [Polyangiaceae bacterium]|nr:hypothetical protein [Polyangiaceae bacterium]
MRAGVRIVALLVACCSYAAPYPATAQPRRPPAAAATDEEEEAAAEEPEAETTEAAPEAAKPTDAPSGTPAASLDTRAGAMRAYHEALAKRRLAATAPLSRSRLRTELARIEDQLLEGRRDEAIGALVYLIESPRFTPFAATDEGRNSVFLLGDALGKAGVYEPARGYLVRLLNGDPNEIWHRRAARSLVDFGLESENPAPFLEDLAKVPPSAPEEVRGDISYLRGRAHEKAGRRAEALAEYTKVSERARFWAQATYLSGLIEVERGQLKRGENLFCRVADAKRTPRKAPLFGGSDFFRVRDLARLGLGRVAHEQYRFDDARYYYYLVPRDSDHIPEALYESATTRYEAKDYDGARELMDELRALDVNHAYEDEAWILDAYIDLGACRFPQADAKLNAFLVRYEPVRNAARRLSADDAAMRKLVETVRTGGDPAAAGLGVRAEVARTLGALLRVDSSYGRASLRLAQLDHQLSGLRGAMRDLDSANQRLSASGVRPQSSGSAYAPDEKLARIEAQLGEVRRLLREAERSTATNRETLAELANQLKALEVRARAARSLQAVGTTGAAASGSDLPAIVAQDRERATRLYQSSQATRAAVEVQQYALARDALVRLDRRLSRLLRRARLGRIETVLGKKRALEIEVEALSQGLLPQTIIDSLDAERYLRDDEEYWPFDGEDWEDEYVGGEGLR